MRTLILLSVFSLFLFHTTFAQPPVYFTPMNLSGPALSQPLDITGSGDGSGRLFVVEKRGSIRIIEGDAVLPDFFLDIRSQVVNNGERGLLGMAFHPKFPDSPYIYVNYVISGTITNQISRFTVNPANANDALEESELKLLSQTGVQSNHKAGGLAFGPDGYLYIGMGDGGGGGDPEDTGQDGSIFLGKMLRIDVDAKTPPLNYSIPPDNPFVNALDTLHEVFYMGLRNPWRYSFDRLTGDFWIADVGQNLWEEIDFIPAGTPGGLNLGWDCREGTKNYQPGNCSAQTVLTPPVFEYPHNCNPCPDGQGASVTGGYVYRGSKYSKLQGYYIFADYVSNYYWLLKEKEGAPGTFDSYPFNGNGTISGIVTFGEGDDGEMYATNLGGTIYAISSETVQEVVWMDVQLESRNAGQRVEWTVELNPDIEWFEIERSYASDFDEIESIGEVNAVPGQQQYSFLDPFDLAYKAYYRIAAHMSDGSVQYSAIVVSNANPLDGGPLVSPVGIDGLSFQLPSPWQNGTLELFDLQGRVLLSLDYKSKSQLVIPEQQVSGIYYVRIISDGDIWATPINY